MEYKELEKLALDTGFSYAAELDVSTLELRQEVRDMCGANTCGMYGRNLACPPACGTLEECRKQVEGYGHGIIVQTVGDVEDSMDFEGMVEIEQRHKKYFYEMTEKLRKVCLDVLPLGSGCCTVCKECAGPGAQCRFPEKRISSLEAYGIVVSDLCSRNGMKYYYGPQKIAYTSCFLLK